MSKFLKCLIALSVLLLPSLALADGPFCNGGRFEPCVCWPNVTKDVAYRPTERLCKGNAAIYLKGKLYRSFSAVVRDRDNRDRWPVSGFNGCSFATANSESPPNSCSAFKTQKLIKRKIKGVDQKVYCLGAPGNSKLFKNVVRITVKVSDIVNPKTGLKDLRRYCLRSPTLPLN